MKKALVILAAAAFVFALPSCKKCSTCKFSYTDPLTNQTVSVDQPEVCGKKKEIDDYEAACKTAASVFGTTCNCSKS